MNKSHPYMGAWIETRMQLFATSQKPPSRTLTWVRGLKQHPITAFLRGASRTLTWVRGLKRAMDSQYAIAQ